MLIDFECIGQLDLFQSLFDGRILICDLVQGELEDCGITLEFQVERVSFGQESELALLREILASNHGLGPGEAGAILTAVTRNAMLLANEPPARYAAAARKIPICGSLDVLRFAAVEGRLLPLDAIALSERMLASGAFFSDSLIEDFRNVMLGEAALGL